MDVLSRSLRSAFELCLLVSFVSMKAARAIDIE